MTRYLSKECTSYITTIQEILDGTRELSHLLQGHVEDCAECRELAATTQLLLTLLDQERESIPTPNLVDRVVPMLIAERQQLQTRRWSRRVAFGSLAASALIGLFIARTGTPAPEVAVDHPSAVTTVAKIETQPPHLEQSFAEAGSAFLSLTKRAAEQSLNPARQLLPGAEPPLPVLPTELEPTPVTTGIPATVEPVTNTARRALNLFIRDVTSLTPGVQRKS